MNSTIIDEIEKEQMRKSVNVPKVGDTVEVSKVIVEGKKKRVQKFEGTVVKVRGKFSRESITVRKLIQSIGVEKTFLVHSEQVPKIKILTRGHARRARLYYLRDRVGKATKIKVKES